MRLHDSSQEGGGEALEDGGRGAGRGDHHQEQDGEVVGGVVGEVVDQPTGAEGNLALVVAWQLEDDTLSKIFLSN